MKKKGKKASIESEETVLCRNFAIISLKSKETDRSTFFSRCPPQTHRCQPSSFTAVSFARCPAQPHCTDTPVPARSTVACTRQGRRPRCWAAPCEGDASCAAGVNLGTREAMLVPEKRLAPRRADRALVRTLSPGECRSRPEDMKEAAAAAARLFSDAAVPGGKSLPSRRWGTHIAP